jgi:hypothetical protein
MALPPPKRVELGAFYPVWGQNNYPQWSGTRPDALVVLGEGDDIGDSFFLTVIVTNDELQFDAHRRASLGSSGR